MKKAFVTLAVILILLPSISFAATREELEAQRIELLQELIVLLQARVQVLLAELGAYPTVLGASISLASTTTPVVIQKSSGGGGGGTGSRHSSGGGGDIVTPTPVPTPLTLDVTGTGNTFTATTNKTLEPESVSVTLPTLRDGIDVPVSLTLRAQISNGSSSYADIELDKEASSSIYSADLSTLLAAGTFTGVFEVIFPDTLKPEDIQYSASFEANGLTRTVDLESAGNSEVFVTPSVDSPGGSAIGVNAVNPSSETTVMKFNVANVGGAQAKVQDMTIGFTAGPVVDGANLFSSVTLVSGSHQYNGTINSDSITFTGMDGVLAGNATNTYELRVQFAPQDGNYAIGQTVYFSLSGLDDMTIMRGDTAEPVVVNGGIVSNTFWLVSNGAILSNFASSQSQVQDSDDPSKSTGEYNLTFDVTAFGTDVYIVNLATPGNVTTSGVLFEVQDSSGIGVTTGTTTATLSSTANIDGTSGMYLIPEGETKSFTLPVTYDPTSVGYYQVQLYAVNFYTNNTASDVQQLLALPVGDYVTSPQSIIN